MNAERSKKLRAAVLLLGTESGGIRTFLLNQQSHAAQADMEFEYLAFQDGPMCAALRAGGGSVTILEVPLPFAHPGAPVASVMRWLILGRGLATARRNLYPHLARRPPDCLYSHFLHTHLVSGAVGGRLAIPRIGHVHGTINVHRMLGLTRLGYSLVLARSLDTIIMVSNTARESLAPFAQKKSRRVYNGIDVRAVEAAGAGVAKIPGRLVALGRIVSGKKVDVAIRAVARVIQSGMDCSLDVVGGPIDQSNEYFEYLRRLSRELNVDHRVNFTGPVSPPYERLAAAEVCVNCSTVEGLSYVVMESFLCRTPIVVADQGSPSEMVQHGQTGLHFKADDAASLAEAVKRLLGDSAMRDRLAQAGAAYARETYDIHTHMQSIRAVFDETISSLSRNYWSRGPARGSEWHK